GESPFCMTFAFFYRASLGGPDERREQKFATLVGDHFGMSPTNILLTPALEGVPACPLIGGIFLPFR
ncbi:hypothetical protein, partial [Geobacillus stearothermophilus]|nr:hypothetical protein [Geobacillus stearothermophilus]